MSDMVVATPVATVDASFRYTEDQRRLILETCCGGASKEEAEALIGIAEARGMNVLAQECYFVKRWDRAKGREVWAVQAAIDSFRIRAEQTGLYNGQDEPEYEHDDKGRVTLARVRVYRKDWDRPMIGVARWDEYVQLTKDGKPTSFWARMPYNQLAKCAEALALRKAFPKVLAKIYTPEEMAQADNPETGAPRPQRGPIKAPALPSSTREQQEEQLPKQLEASVDLLERAVDANDMLMHATTMGELHEAWSFVMELRRQGLSGKPVEDMRQLKERRKSELSNETAAAQ